MEHDSNLHACTVSLFRKSKLLQFLNSRIILVLSLALLFSLSSCGTSRQASYEQQRRGLLMLEGENIYKNKGFYHSKASYKQRKKTMRKHRRSYRR